MVNKTILELAQVYASHTHGETIEFLNELVSLRDELIDTQTELMEEDVDDESVSKALSEIEEQIVYLNRNIRTVEDALLCHNAKTFEKRLTRGGVATYCLN